MRTVRRSWSALCATFLLMVALSAPAAANNGSEPKELFNAGGTLLFVANDGVHGRALWRSDGTEQGTFLVKDVLTGVFDLGDPQIAGWARLAGKTYFVGDGHLWVTDGRPEGTKQVKDRLGHPVTGAAPAQGDGLLREPGLAVMGGKVYLNAPLNGVMLTRTDGTRAGTSNVYALRGSLYYRFRVVKKRLFFVAERYLKDGVELWVTDGTWKGTRRVKDIRSGRPSSNPKELTQLGSRVLFTADDGTRGRELWISDGTAAGTRLVKDIFPGLAASEPNQLLSMGGKVYFSASDPAGDRGLWRTDGTSGGTVRIADVVPDASDEAGGFARLGSSLLFGAGDALWKTNGSVGNATKIADLRPERMVAVGDRVFLVTRNGRSEQLHRTDGTEGGTVAITLDGMVGDYEIRAAVAVGDRLFFTASDATNDAELWAVAKDQTVAHLVKDINQTG